MCSRQIPTPRHVEVSDPEALATLDTWWGWMDARESAFSRQPFFLRLPKDVVLGIMWDLEVPFQYFSEK